MNTTKYQNMIFKRMEGIFQQWFEKESILEHEMYHFLHTLKGTAGTIGLQEVTALAMEKLESLSEKGEKKWPQAEWQRFLQPLIDYVETNGRNEVVYHTKKAPVIPMKKNLEKDFILIIDDDVEFITFTKEVLENEGYTVMVSSNGKRGLELIYDIKPALILLDIYLPDIDGFTILKNIVEKTKKMYVSTILISADGSKENRIRAYDLGALDFISKPIDKDVFVSFIRNRLAFKKEIEQSITIDELTQLYNRKYMNTQLQKQIEAFERAQEAFSVALLDLDHFKKVNDTYGHIIGDEVLQGFAFLMKEMKRDEDFVFRYGGEEFAMLFPKTKEKEAFNLIERMRKRFSEKPFTANGVTFHVTFSAGIVQSHHNNLHREKLIDQADQALYLAKKSGRNQSKIFALNQVISKESTTITIIIVDDDFIIRERLAQHFATWNPGKKFEIQVLEFSDGVSFLRSNWYKPGDKFMILLDGMMPKMDGFDVLTKIREKYPTKDVLVSMLTGRKGKEHVIRALESGADDYIIKPFDTNEISTRILRLIERMFV